MKVFSGVVVRANEFFKREKSKATSLLMTDMKGAPYCTAFLDGKVDEGKQCEVVIFTRNTEELDFSVLYPHAKVVSIDPFFMNGAMRYGVLLLTDTAKEDDTTKDESSATKKDRIGTEASAMGFQKVVKDVKSNTLDIQKAVADAHNKDDKENIREGFEKKDKEKGVEVSVSDVQKVVDHINHKAEKKDAEKDSEKKDKKKDKKRDKFNFSLKDNK